VVALLVAMALPFTPAGAWFGFVTPPPHMLAGTGLIVDGLSGVRRAFEAIGDTLDTSAMKRSGSCKNKEPAGHAPAGVL
jgi:hypothetical protein